MRAICVDDERALMERAVSLCRELPGMEEVTGFTRPAEALAWVSENSVDLALLDVEMPGMSGIELAAALSLLSMLELIALAWDLDALLYGSGVGLCAATLALVPTMDRGVKKWQT